MTKKKLSKVERQEKIIEILEEKGSVDVSELSKLFSISDMSIRNDLNDLGRQRKLQRKYGGANTIQINSKDLPLTEKQKRNYKEKKLIGREAAKLIRDGDSIMFDAGTTTEHVANFLHNYHDLTIITNGINIINSILQYPNINIYTSEGKVDASSYAIIGEKAEKSLKKYNVNISFISIDGLSLDLGLTNNSLEATNITNIILNNSRTKIMVADSSKIGQIGAFSLCSCKDINVWVTDYKVPNDFKKRVEALGVKVIIAEK